jgi:hypothetical protein
MRKITNMAIVHCSRSYQYNFSASNYTFESFAMVSPKERADYNIKRRLNRANESQEERRQRRENWNQSDRDQRENETPNNFVAKRCAKQRALLIVLIHINTAPCALSSTYHPTLAVAHSTGTPRYFRHSDVGGGRKKTGNLYTLPRLPP